MPIYEYRCEKCGLVTEIMQRLSDPPLEECQKCSGPLRKHISPPAIIFKGSGWYVTDFPTKDRKEGMKKENGDTCEKKTESSSNTVNTEKSGVQA